MNPRVLVVAMLASALAASPAEAADPIAEELFHTGRQLMDEGRYGEACPKLAESQRREPLSGTLMTLGHCHERQGKTATAWAEYRGAMSLAGKEGRKAYYDTAEQFAQAVEPRLTRLRVSVAGRPPDARVTLDDQLVAPSSYGLALPVDPGQHLVAAEAPGHHRHEQRVLAEGEGATLDVRIPALVPDPQAADAPAPIDRPVPSGAGPVAPQPPPAPDAAGGEVPIWAWVVGGIGLASLGVSAGFFADQRSAAGAIEAACGEERQTCPPQEDFDFEAEHTREKRSGALFIGFGIAGLVGVGASVIGIVVGVTSDRPAQAAALRLWTPPGDGGIGVEARF